MKLFGNDYFDIAIKKKINSTTDFTLNQVTSYFFYKFAVFGTKIFFCNAHSSKSIYVYNISKLYHFEKIKSCKLLLCKIK